MTLMVVVLQVYLCLSVSLGVKHVITRLPKFEQAHRVFGHPTEPFWIDIYGHAKVETVREALAKYHERYPLALAFASASGNLDVVRHLVRRHGYGRDGGEDSFDEFVDVTSNGYVIEQSVCQPPPYYDASQGNKFRAIEAYLAAAANGHVHVMKFLETEFNGLLYDEALKLATLRGHVRIAQHLIVKFSMHVPSKLCRDAARYNNLDIVQIFISTADNSDREIRYLAEAFLGAFQGGHFSITQYVVKICEVEEPRLSHFRLKMKLIELASKEDYVDLIRYFFNTGAITLDDTHMISPIIHYARENIIYYLHSIGYFRPVNYIWLCKACREDNYLLVSFLASHGYKVRKHIDRVMNECFTGIPLRLDSAKVFMYLVVLANDISNQDIVDCLRLDKSRLKPKRARQMNNVLFKMIFKRLGWDAFTLIRNRPERKFLENAFLKPLLVYQVGISGWNFIDSELDRFVNDHLSYLTSTANPTLQEAIEKCVARFNSSSLLKIFSKSEPYLSMKQLLQILTVAANRRSTSGIVRTVIRQETRLAKHGQVEVQIKPKLVLEEQNAKESCAVKE